MSGAQLTAFYAIVGAYLLLVCGIGLYNYRVPEYLFYQAIAIDFN